jgi:TusA-related sulfurtransferase
VERATSVSADIELISAGHLSICEKLKLEMMDQGQVLAVLLDDGDPIKNVPRSVENEGHTVLAQDRVGSSYRVLIRREETH